MDRIIEINESIGLTIELLDTKRYHIWKTIDGEKDIILTTIRDKAVTQIKMKDEDGKLIYSLLEEFYPTGTNNVSKIKSILTSQFNKVTTSLEQLRSNLQSNVKADNSAEVDEAIRVRVEIEEAKMREKYPPLYKKFERRCKRNNFTPLQFVAHITQGLGVGLTIEVIKAFFGFLQTYLGFKGTNVIAVGDQSAGKSHILETALSFIPEERVHMGVTSPAYFFRKYNHMDLTGHIFYLGDLGGDNDNQNSIEMRDILKQLSTDGYIERGLVDDESDTEEQWVEGYPCLAYSTAKENMINAQERSRSMVITPPDVDPERLMTFKTIMRSPGSYSSVINQIQEDRDSVKGLVYYLKEEKSEFDIFNPFLYNIVDYMGDIEDFNRKVDEFNSILSLCCELNKGYCIMQHIIDDNFDEVDKPLLIASKQDVLNALSIFDTSNGLLPTEVSLANGLIREYEPYKLESGLLDYDQDYENSVKNCLAKVGSTNDVNWRDESQNSFFTESSIRRKFSTYRWYRKNKEEIEIKLRKLYLNNVLIQVGVDNKEPVYGLNYNMTSKVNNIKPTWGGKSFRKGKELFESTFPNSYDEFDKIVTKDVQLNITTIDFEINGSELYELPW